MARRQKQQVSGPAVLVVFVVIVVGSIVHACDPDGPSSQAQSASAAPISSAPSTTTVTVPPAPAPVDVATVATVETPTGLVLSDHRRIYVSGLYTANPSNERTASACQKRTDLALAKSLLLHKQVTLEPPQYAGSDDGVPAGYTQMKVAVAGQDYADTYDAQIYDKREAACPTPTPTPAPSSGTSSDDGSVDVYVPGHHNLPDGALTGGFCARHWWC